MIVYHTCNNRGASLFFVVPKLYQKYIDEYSGKSYSINGTTLG